LLLVFLIFQSLFSFHHNSLQEFVTGSSYLVRWLSIALAGLAIGFLLLDPKKILKCFFVIAGLLALLGFGQLLVMPDLKELAKFGWDAHVGRLVATWFDPNYLGGFFAFAAALAFGISTYVGRQNKRKLLALVLLLGVATVLTFSRSAYLAFGISFFIVGIFRARKVLLAGAVILLLGVMLVPRALDRIEGAVTLDKTAQMRFESWTAISKIIAENWQFGVGTNFLPKELLRVNYVQNINQPNASGSDSSLLNILAMMGIVGGLLVLVFLFLLLQASWKLFQKNNSFASGFGLGFFAATIGLLVHSNFVNSLFYPLIMIVFWIMIGVLMRLMPKKKPKQKILRV